MISNAHFLLAVLTLYLILGLRFHLFLISFLVKNHIDLENNLNCLHMVLSAYASGYYTNFVFRFVSLIILGQP